MQKHLCHCEVFGCLTGKRWEVQQAPRGAENQTALGVGVGVPVAGAAGFWCGHHCWMPCFQAFGPSAHDSRAGLSHWSHLGHVPVPCDGRAGPLIKELPYLPVPEGLL